MYADTLDAISTLRGLESELFITSENLIEFWRSATRPAQKNGLGLTIAETLTFNVRDFNRYASQVTPVNPTSFKHLN
jgi:hypothetical protein